MTSNTTTIPHFRPSVAALGLPLLFIVMWSSGYVAGKAALPFVGPYTMIFLRFASAALVLLMVAVATRAPWPKTWKEVGHIAVVGLLIQAMQFSGLYTGINLGVSAGVSALIVGTMPIFVALGASVFLSERIKSHQWIGLLIGLAGVVLVVSEKFSLGETTLGGYIAILFALLGITLGTLYQKKFCTSMDLRTGGLIQLSVAATFAFITAHTLEDLYFQVTPTFLFATSWMSLVNSIGAISVLYVMIRRGEASKVASLFYLIPGMTAIMAFVILGETLHPLAMIGFAVAAFGVYLNNR
ncbi:MULTISPECIES: DMT family transporter [unclassified Halomonas]|uniref:DMT family transporter n=1 Tax=unclassified Halomonas TaxID=2609666 RepID=UPI0007DA13F0|nr:MULTISPECIES: DMT family transporter [unclassified Halomonas]MBT2788317.1 DMT family transporter [Halomonas sp. ISL-106]MBT2796066.1 DMT family transporter [Halomonas sp. ISL-104]OAL61334.1 drug/metabolite transporter [Halomonas sp. ALS9]